MNDRKYREYTREFKAEAAEVRLYGCTRERLFGQTDVQSAWCTTERLLCLKTASYEQPGKGECRTAGEGP